MASVEWLTFNESAMKIWKGKEVMIFEEQYMSAEMKYLKIVMVVGSWNRTEY